MQVTTAITGDNIFTATAEFNKEDDMYEKLDRLRADVERWKQKVEEDKGKLKAAEQKLKEAENAQIIADVGAVNFSPEQLALFLQQVASGQLGTAITEKTSVEKNDKSSYADETDNDEETEDFDDEETEYQN